MNVHGTVIMPSRIVIVRTGPLNSKAKAQIAFVLTLLLLAAVMTIVLLFSLMSLMAALALGVFLLLGLPALVIRLVARLGRGRPDSRLESLKPARDK